MEEIKVGEYVRTKEGSLDKVTEIVNNYVLLKSKITISEYGESRIFIKKLDIIKHSPNIIDLIEKGDYVNGEKVTGIMSGYVYLDKIDIETKKVKTLTDYQIKDIVTKEMFNQVKYEV